MVDKAVPEVRYTLSMPEPHTHLLEVDVRLTSVQQDEIQLVMPSWIPGSYLIREFPRNVQDFSARASSGAQLPWRKVDKNRWLVQTGAAGDVLVHYRIYANELTARTSHLDSSHAHVNGPSVFMYVDGHEDAPLQLHVQAPAEWRVSTALPEIGSNTFSARSYDELVDSPLEIGTHELIEWYQHGLPHAFAIWGRAYHPHERLLQDAREIIDAAARIFGGLPYQRYLFILHLVPSGRGGLEHASSTVLQMGRDAFEGESYESLLALIAHEFFHVWNAKRIRPMPLGPFDYTGENYTRNLWVVEGLTTYYTDLLLVRAGLIKPERYLERLADSIARHQALPGRKHQSLSDSSFDTWIKFYRPDAHTPNAQISYYHKGALVALLLDMEIRRASDNERSLDDLMRLLWERYGALDIGFPEDPAEGIRALAEKVLGTSLSDFFARYIDGTDELDFDSALATAGLRIEEKDDGTTAGEGLSGTAAAPARPTDAVVQETRLGIRTSGGGGARVTHALNGTPAHAAGVNAGDEIIAVDGLRVDSAKLPARLRHRPSGEMVSLAIFRRDELMTIEVALGEVPAPKLRLVPLKERDDASQAVHDSWLRLEGAG
ncbi:PDZ domain-containing protein [soil metagenome]